ncbi:hypothetical protein [Sulfurimonas sp.]|jgi:archaellum component FlaC|uniref:hypothetical protein n=1 Tax=Sulfurimonas sp. TaxID=2022749 RepID=UPI0025DDCA23|nr:hypothetical protein [Sulfurimonas sp.]MBT5933926.1 hypothetical protein [Sulfurimonas sp.]
MAIDNSLYNSLEITYLKIRVYLEKTQLGREHSMMIVRHEELADLLETFDIEALEEQSKDINALHEQLNAIKEVSQKIIQDLQETSDSVSTANKVVSGLDIIFSKIASIIL